MNTKLGDVLLAGILKDPQSVGRIITEAINRAETPIAAANIKNAKTAPKSTTEAKTKGDTKSEGPVRVNVEDRPVSEVNVGATNPLERRR